MPLRASTGHLPMNLCFRHRLQLSNGFIGCKRALDMRVNLIEESRLVSGSRMCAYESNSSDWLLSACCNPLLLFTQCCVPGDHFIKVKTIDRSSQGLDTVSIVARFWQRLQVWWFQHGFCYLHADFLCISLGTCSSTPAFFIWRVDSHSRRFIPRLRRSSKDTSIKSSLRALYVVSSSLSWHTG